MHLSKIAAIIEAASVYPLIGIRRHMHYIIVDIGRIDDMGHPSPIIPFIVADAQLADAADGVKYLRILTSEACEKLNNFLPQVAVHT